ncbi:MAG: hypothetical protein SVU32_09560 [Candidatus Nanohaloarchaea archaeon]|nr:hypothetical protein [Candidatus Nanohaloarchaea archaeon]
MTQSRRDFLKEAGLTVGIYGGILGALEGVNMAVGYGFDATDDYEGHTTIEELNNNMGEMNGAEITVEGYPAFLEARKNLLDIEPVDWDHQLDDWDISDDDGWFNAEVMDDDDIIYDAEEVYKLHENPNGGSSIIVYDESNDIENALGERPEQGDPADQRVAIYGTVKRGKRGYTVEIDQAETV